MTKIWLLFAVLLAGGSAEVFGVPLKSDNLVKASLVSDTTAIEAGKPFRVGIRLIMEPGWHTYWKDPGDAGLATAVKWTLPKGFKAGELQWPAPRQIVEPGNIKANAYQGETLLTATITPPKILTEKNITFSARVDWLVCEKVCLPGAANLELTLPVGPSQPTNQELFNKYPPGGSPLTENIPTFQQPKTTSNPFPVAESSLPKILLYAVLGGLILNIMPCVLPVISLKIFSFIQEAHNDSKTIFKLGLTFASGILISFWILAAVVVLLKSAGHQIGWGFQLQNPYFVLALSVIVLVFGLSLFGLFEVFLPVSIQSAVGTWASKSGYQGAFFNGFLATALATPCTAPFLAPALGYAFSRSGFEIFSVFTAVGFGLALPYLLLTAQPAWMKHLPKPGPWLEKVKQFMGFLLMATLLWLFWILGSQFGYKSIVWIGAFLLMVSLGCWLIGSCLTPLSSSRQKIVIWTTALALSALGFYWFIPRALGTTDSEQIAWEKFSTQSLNRYLSEKKTVFLDFSAEWCLTCKVNENAILETDDVRSTIQNLHIIPMKADWTKYDPEITRQLAKFDRSGVPLYVIFPGKDPEHPIVLPEVITKNMLIEQLKIAGTNQTK